MAVNQSPTQGAGAPVLVIEKLRKVYGSFVALNDLTISLDAGQILGLIGPNGAGKTTTIKILVGLSRPTSGIAQIAGVDCVKDSQKIKSLVGYMPDTFGSYDNMRVHEYLDFFGATFGIPRKVRVKRIPEVMEITNTTYMKDRFVESLSHGMQQRIGLARTLIHDPKVLILDEPVNGLDPQARIEMRDLLIQLSQRGKTLLVTSHILPELARICTRVAIMTNGTLRAFGTVEEIGRQVSQKRTVEAVLMSSGQVAAAAEIVRKEIESDAEIFEVPLEATVRFRTSLPESKFKFIMARLIQGRMDVTQFREVQTDLEDAFMSFAKPQKNTVSGAPAETGAAHV